MDTSLPVEWVHNLTHWTPHYLLNEFIIKDMDTSSPIRWAHYWIHGHVITSLANPLLSHSLVASPFQPHYLLRKPITTSLPVNKPIIEPSKVHGSVWVLEPGTDLKTDKVVIFCENPNPARSYKDFHNLVFLHDLLLVVSGPIVTFMLYTLMKAPN